GWMNVDRTLQQRVRCAGQHDELENLNEFAAFGGEDRRSEDLVGLGIDYDFHQPGGLVALDGAGDPGRWNLADFELVAGRSGFFLGQSDPAQLGIGKDRVGNEAAVGGEVLPLDEIRVHDLVVVVRDMRECWTALDVPEGPDARHVRFQAPVDI